MERHEIKVFAKSKIKGRWGSIFLYCLVAYLTILFAGILGYPINYGYIEIIYSVINDDEPNQYTFLKGYHDLNTGLRFTALILIISLFTMLWSLLFIIPGIYKSYSYSASLYIFRNNPNIPIFDCIKESKKAMKGHIWERFVFSLSFIPLDLLALITLEIYQIYLIPYKEVTYMKYYQMILVPDYLDEVTRVSTNKIENRNTYNEYIIQE